MSYTAGIRITNHNGTLKMMGSRPEGGYLSTQSQWVGIPHPTDYVPSAIMPTLPTGADTIIWDIDPIGTATPTWMDAANQYYVDPGHVSANDANNGGRGSPTLPRATVPGLSFTAGGSWTLSEGDQIFIVGDGNIIGNVDDIQSITMPGTSANPVWIIGVSSTARPRLNFKRFIEQTGGMSYVFYDNLHFGGTNDYRATFAGCTNVCYRNCELSGSGVVSGASRRLISLNGTSSQINKGFVIYNNEIHGIGSWNPGYSVIDCLGVHIQEWTRHTWVLNNHIYNCQGDSVMTGNSNFWDFDHARRSHYSYIAGNHFHHNFENGYDCKDSYHVIVSGNDMHDFYSYGTEPTVNATAVIMGQDSEGFLSGYIWILNNHIYNTMTGIRCSCTSDTYRGYAIGNLIENCDGVGVLLEPRGYTYPTTQTRTHADYAGAINNTIVGCGDTGMYNERGSSDCEIEFTGNILTGCTGTYDVWLRDYGNVRTYKDNIIYRDGINENVLLQGSITTSNNTEGTDPGLDSNGVPSSGSIANNYMAEHSSFSLFQSLYGIDIREDRLGVSRSPTVTDAGAHEVV